MDGDILPKLEGFFRSSLDHPTWIDWRKNSMRCWSYRDGDQWDAAELAILRERHQPATVNNQVKVTVDRIMGQFVQLKSRVGYRGRNYPADEQTAVVLDELFRHIAQNNQLAFEERDCFHDGIVSGFGVLGVRIEFDDLLAPSIIIEHVDSSEVYPDPHSRQFDWNRDAAWISRSKWYPFEEAMELHPKYADRLATLRLEEPTDAEGFKNRDFIDFDEQGHPMRVRIVETWYKTYKRERMVITTDAAGRPMRISPETLEAMEAKERAGLLRGGSREIERTKQVINCGVHSCDLLLDHKEDPHRHGFFPYIPFFVERKKTGEPFGPISVALTMQDAINKRESKAIHLLNTKQTIFRKGLISDKTALAEEIHRPDGMIEVEGPPDQLIIHQNIELAQSQFLMHQQAKDDFRRVTGINTEALGERSEVRSGVGIARKQQAAELILSPAFDNFARSRQILGRVVLAMISSYYDEPTVLMVTDELGKNKQVALGPENLESIKRGIYDVVVEEVPDFGTLQQEQQQLLFQVLPQVIQFGPQWTKILLEMSSIKGKEDIIKQVEEMGRPPPPEPKYSINIQWDVLSPEEKVAFAGQLGLQSLAQAEMQAGVPSSVTARRETEISREMIRAGSAGQVAKLQLIDREKGEKKQDNG